MISEMTRFEIVGPRDELWSTLDELQNLGTCHLEPASLEIPGSEHRLERLPLPEEDQALRSDCEELSPRYEELLGDLPASVFRDEDAIATHEASIHARGRDHLVRMARARLATYKGLQERLANLEENRDLLERYLQILQALGDLHVPQSWAVVPLLMDDTVPWEQTLEDVSQICKISGDQGKVDHTYKKIKGGTWLLALAVPSEYEGAVREYAWENKIPEAVFPREYADLPPMKVRDKLEARLSEIPDDIAEAEVEIREFLRSTGPELVALGHLVIDTAQRFSASQKAALSEYAFRLHGWIPNDAVGEVESAIQRMDGGIEFQTLPSDPHHDTPPSRITNPGIFRPAQTLLKIFPPPTYGGVDPSALMLLTFPLFFGWMVGDAGYGGVLLILVLLVKWMFGAKSKPLNDVLYVFVFAALSSIFFGVLFGEYFGHFGVWVVKGTWSHDEHLYLWMGRTPSYLPKYLGLSLGLGLIHMTISLLFGIYQAADHLSHGDEHAEQHLMEKVGMLVSLWGFFLVTVTGLVPPLAHVGAALPGSPGLLANLGWAMVVGGIVLLGYALPGLQKVTAPIEAVGIVSNTISYARLMAVGAAGVVLADMANRVGQLAAGQSWPVAIMFILLCVLVHAAAFVLIIFDPLLQGLRLHFVEFFSKFYEPNGVEYTPFARKGGSY